MPLRDYQHKIVQHAAGLERSNVWAGMGTGKTLSMLTAIDDAIAMRDIRRPVLVLAPKRVATSTWPDEVAKWRFDRPVSVVVGDREARLRALRARAHIYVCNYDSVQWLVKTTIANGGWPFEWVIADEASKLKGFRLQQGAARARELARIAHQATRRWTNLTGTPAPNGLLDLWGQQWFIDRGKRLGQSYSAYEQRWFYYPAASGGRGVGKRPDAFEHAQAEIEKVLSDCTISVQAKDFLDLPPLVENRVEVTMPEDAKRIYRKMLNDWAVELRSGTINAFNAAAKSAKLLQCAAGFMYDETRGGHWVHTEKLDALQDILDEAAGMPILVSYQHIEVRDEILRRFKGSRHLDDNPQTIRDWNAGRIPLLLAHPKSAGHGLNLQDGGNILVYIESGFNLEEDQQILERVGPTRQRQSGHNRPVFVHRIFAKGTRDEDVLDVLAGKATVQSLLLDNMR